MQRHILAVRHLYYSRSKQERTSNPIAARTRSPGSKTAVLSIITGGGKPCIKGTRIWVSLILDFLASGETAEQILEPYPQLTADDIRAAIAYGAEVARARVIPVPNAAAE